MELSSLNLVLNGTPFRRKRWSMLCAKKWRWPLVKPDSSEKRFQVHVHIYVFYQIQTNIAYCTFQMKIKTSTFQKQRVKLLRTRQWRAQQKLQRVSEKKIKFENENGVQHLFQGSTLLRSSFQPCSSLHTWFINFQFDWKISEFIVQRGEKLLRNCSLIGAKHVLVDERNYCLTINEKMNQTTAMAYCEKLNATLPLPLSLLEFEVFSSFSKPNKTWIGISDSSNSGKKENWRDVKNKRPAYVK